MIQTQIITKISTTTLFIIMVVFSTVSAFAQEIPTHIKDIARTALNYSENGQCEKALGLFDKLIDYGEETNNYELVKIVKSQKISCYWSIAKNKVNNDVHYGLLETCTNGLQLCNEINEQYSLNTIMFSIWIAGYYYANSDYLECNYAIDYAKRLINECRNKSIEPEYILDEAENMIRKLEKEVDRLTSPPSTYSFSLGALFDAFTSNSSEPTYTTSNNTKTKVVIKKSDNNTEVEVFEDGVYKYGKYRSPKYKVVCPSGYYNHIYYNIQKKCWMKTSSIFCDYSSNKSNEGLKKSAKILCGNN